MAILVTGATGFVGWHVARLLAAAGTPPRCLVRPGTDPARLTPLGVEIVRGDLRDAASLRAAAAGCHTVYHVAADYRLWTRDPQEMYDSNVEGTSLLLDAAADAQRIVYTSTVGCLGHPPDGSPGDETTPTSLDELTGHYKKSKYLAEQVALRRAAEGQPIVIVNPSTPVGEGDHKPTRTGQIIVDFLRGKMPGFVDTGLNWVDVHDVAAGHLLAAERGKVGERYILGGENLSLEAVLHLLADISGRPRPRFRVPLAVAFAAARANEFYNVTLRRRPPTISVESVRLAAELMYFTPAKAIRDLGLPQTPIRDALTRAVEWYYAHGYARRVSKRGTNEEKA